MPTVAVERGGELSKLMDQAGLSMIFARGTQPCASDVERALASAGAHATITFIPPDTTEGWLELLVSGLTFDMRGLAPAEPCPLPEQGHFFGLERGLGGIDPVAVTIVPGGNIASGFAMIPVVQAMTGFTAGVALPLGAVAVCWHPAQSWMAPQYFSRIVLNWLSDGPFPALGLTSLQASADGLTSEGLSYFVGQEVHVDRRECEAVSDTAKLAVRLIDFLVANGPMRSALEFPGPGGEVMRAEPSASGKLVTVRRQV